MLGQAKIISPSFFPPIKKKIDYHRFFGFLSERAKRPSPTSAKNNFSPFGSKVNTCQALRCIHGRRKAWKTLSSGCDAFHDAFPGYCVFLFRLDKFKNIFYYKKCLIL
jgi:hypothetical protein